jgi:hypothetical protein
MLLRFGHRVSCLAVAVLTAVAVFAAAVPANADEAAPAAASHGTAAAKRVSTSLANSLPAGNPATTGRDVSGYANGGFLYGPGTQPGMNIGGRLNVGKSHVYVPYYGNISNDPLHPGVQGTAGIAYGFRTWDISVYNAGGITPGAPPIPGLDAPPKANPALSLSIRF